jgi:hypothetical protein
MVTLVRALASEAPTDPAALSASLSRLVKLSDEEAGAAWVRIKQVRAAFDAMESALDLRARHHGLPLPDGSTLVPVEATRKTIDVEKALPVLRERFGGQVDAVVDRSLAVGAVEKLVRQIVTGRGLKKKTDEVFDDLRKAGALREVTHPHGFRVKKPRSTSPSANAIDAAATTDEAADA